MEEIKSKVPSLPPPILSFEEEDEIIQIINDKVLRDVVDWIKEQRTKLCPNTAYRGVKANLNIINGNCAASQGLFTKFFLECKHFKEVVSICPHNLIPESLRHLSKKSSNHFIYVNDVYRWISDNYQTKAKESLLFLDISQNGHYEIQTRISKRSGKVNDYCIIKNEKENISLMALIEKCFKKVMVPLIVLRLPTDSPVDYLFNNRLPCINTYVANENIDKLDKTIFVALLRKDEGDGDSKTSLKRDHSSEVVETGIHSSKKAKSKSEIPSVQSLKQFEYVYSSRDSNDLWQRVCQNLSSNQMYGCLNGVEELKNQLIKSITEGKNDKAIYGDLFKKLHEEIVFSDEYLIKNKKKDEPIGEGSFRADNRVKQIFDLIPRDMEVKNILDVGCAEASITSSLGKRLNLSKDKVHGVDIRDLNVKEDVTFKVIIDGWKLEYEDASFDIVCTLMAMHHFEKLDELLKDIYRVLKPGGLLIVREHDCYPENISVFLDIVHGMYSLVWKNPLEWPEFIEQHYQNYQPREYWTEELRKLGLSRIEEGYKVKEQYNSCKLGDRSNSHGRIANAIRAYYAIYRK